MFTHLKFQITVFWEPEEGYFASGYECWGEDGPFDGWDLLEAAALPNVSHPKIAQALGVASVDLLNARERALKNSGLRQRLL